MRSDWELIREYVDDGSDDAFRQIVERHAGMVLAVANRVVRDNNTAQDITQAVFLLLARKAATLQTGTLLPGWLHRTAELVSRQALRTEMRRQGCQARFAQMENSEPTQADWNAIASSLDEILASLGEQDRSVIVLRFMEDQSFAQVANTLGVTEAAAKMRVGRAIERLRTALGRRGVELSSVSLASALGTHDTSPHPTELSASIVSAVLTGGSAASVGAVSLVTETLKIMTWKKIKMAALISIALLLLGTAGAFLASRHARWWPRQTPLVSTLEPLSGDWVGTYTQETDDVPRPPQQIELQIRTSDEGRRCSIEMRIPSTVTSPPLEYHFTHSLSATRRTIHTDDDRRLALLNGDAPIVDAQVDPSAPEWMVAFEIKRPPNLGKSTCRWTRRGTELHIDRLDELPGPQGLVRIQGHLRLQKAPGGTKAP